MAGCFSNPLGGLFGGGGGSGGMPGMSGGGDFMPTGGGGMPGGMCGGSDGSSNAPADPNAGIGANPATPPSEQGSTYDKMMGSTRLLYKNDIPWFDPLGANESGSFQSPTGGPEQRKFIFDALTAMRPELAANSANSVKMLQDAAANPGYNAAAGLANSQINGDYLHGSPEFEAQMNAMRQTAGQQAENQNAAIRGQFARNGVGFSTANQQAQQSNNAQARAGVAQAEAAARAANYANERNIQNNSVSLLDQATGAPINYLSQVPAADMAPLSMAAQMVAGLAGGGQPVVRPQDVVEKDGYLRSLTKSIGAL